MTATTTPLSEQTPVEIDTELARLMGEQFNAERQIEIAFQNLHTAAGDRRKRDQFTNSYVWQMTDSEAHDAATDRARSQVADAQQRLNTVLAEGVPFRAEFQRRGGWTRAFLVVNNGGHVHSTRGCSTCFVSTKFFWVTDLSGADEAEIVAKAGERACTVCYPSAPVEVLSRPTQIFSDEERDQAKAREERAAKRAEKDAAQLVDPDTNKVLFKTVRGATNQISSNLNSLCFYGVSHPYGPAWVAENDCILKALAARGVEYDIEPVLAKIRKKVEKEMRGGSFADPYFKAQY